MSKYTFIVNPAAGKGKVRKVLVALSRQLKRRAVPHILTITESAGQATELSKNSTSDVVVAVGGDGTVNEVANGLMGSDKVLGIIPSGSGNDLVKSLGISRKFDGALDALLAERTKRIDAATVECKRHSANAPDVSFTRRFFVNGVGIGFDAAVANRTNEMKFLSGIAVYVLAVFQTLGKYKAPLFEMTFDGVESKARKLLIAIGNGTCAGGGFYLTPRAKVDDGLLDICLLDDFAIPSIMMIMPKVMRGAHESSRGVKMQRARRISINAEDPFFVHADGEIVGRDVNSVEIAVVPDALNVIVGDSA